MCWSYFYLVVFLCRTVMLAVAVPVTTRKELESLRQLDQHYRKSLTNTDKLSTPFQRITRLIHKRGKIRKHVSIIGSDVHANGPDKSRNAHLVIESDSFGTIKIHSVTTPIYYLCIGKNYKPTGVPKEALINGQIDVANCKFKESFTDKFVQFKSVKYYSEEKNTGCLGFNRLGNGKKINRSRCHRNNTLFMERKSRIIIDIYKNASFKNKLFDLLRNQKKLALS